MTTDQIHLEEVIDAVRDGDPTAESRLIRLSYDQLRSLAGNFMRRERSNHTLQPTALVNEAIARVIDQLAHIGARDRAYYFAAMANAMRRVLVDHARTRHAARRGGPDAQRHELDYAIGLIEGESHIDLLSLDEALQDLAALNPRHSEVVNLRFFGGLTIPEIARHLEISVSTVERDWAIARAWLQVRLGEGDLEL